MYVLHTATGFAAAAAAAVAVAAAATAAAAAAAVAATAATAVSTGPQQRGSGLGARATHRQDRGGLLLDPVGGRRTLRAPATCALVSQLAQRRGGSASYPPLRAGRRACVPSLARRPARPARPQRRSACLARKKVVRLGLRRGRRRQRGGGQPAHGGAVAAVRPQRGQPARGAPIPHVAVGSLLAPPLAVEVVCPRWACFCSQSMSPRFGGECDLVRELKTHPHPRHEREGVACCWWCAGLGGRACTM